MRHILRWPAEAAVRGSAPWATPRVPSLLPPRVRRVSHGCAPDAVPALSYKLRRRAVGAADDGRARVVQRRRGCPDTEFVTSTFRPSCHKPFPVATFQISATSGPIR